VVLSHIKNLIFFHVPKCGGTSFVENNRDIWDNPQGNDHIHFSYRKSKEYFIKIGDVGFWDTCDMYARVREPIARMKSLFSYVKNHKDHPMSIDTNNGFEQFVELVIKKNEVYLYDSCFNYLMNEDGLIDPRIKIERLEDVKGEKIHNSTESGKVEVTKAAEEMIREHFKKDYETWY
jgi:hypothetical protein